MIPKIIHCCWFGGPKTALAERCCASWRQFAPDWEIREWGLKGEPEAACLVSSSGLELLTPRPEFVRGAIVAKRWAMVSDWVRMAVLHEYGGVYFDFDEELVAPFTGLPVDEWCAAEYTSSGGSAPAPGAGLALEKGSEVAKKMLALYAKTPFDSRRQMMPFIWEHCDFSRLVVLPPEVLSPRDPTGRFRCTGRTLGVHHYAMGGAPRWRKVLQWMCFHGMKPVVDAMVRVKRALAG